MNQAIVLAITGASGAVFAQRLLQVLLEQRREVHLTVSPSGSAVIEQELGRAISADRFAVEEFLQAVPAWRSSAAREVDTATCVVHHYNDMLAPIASGSHRTAGMVICPCSGSTLSGVAHAASRNLIQRAAEVHLKERRPLVVVPRETPLSSLQLENMQRLVAAGAVVLPAMPGWYHGVATVDDLVDFVVARILDALQIDNALMRRWGSE